MSANSQWKACVGIYTVEPQSMSYGYSLLKVPIKKNVTQDHAKFVKGKYWSPQKNTEKAQTVLQKKNDDTAV